MFSPTHDAREGKKTEKNLMKNALVHKWATKNQKRFIDTALKFL